MSTPSPSRVIVSDRPTSSNPSVVDVCDEQARRVRAQVDGADAHRSVRRLHPVFVPIQVAAALKRSPARVDLDRMRHKDERRALVLAVVMAVAAIPLRSVGRTRPHRRGRAPMLRITERDFHISVRRRSAPGTCGCTSTIGAPIPTSSDRARAARGGLPLRPDGLTVNEEALRSTRDGRRARSAARPADLRVRLTPGRYVLFCNMAGHYLAECGDGDRPVRPRRPAAFRPLETRGRRTVAAILVTFALVSAVGISSRSARSGARSTRRPSSRSQPASARLPSATSTRSCSSGAAARRPGDDCAPAR